jgi:hypothetical protein
VLSEAKDPFGGLWEKRSELILRFAQDDRRTRFLKFAEVFEGA